MNQSKRYTDYNSYLRGLFGERVQKIAVDAGLTCPNRDGTLSDQGCIYCNAKGSGTGAFAQGMGYQGSDRSRKDSHDEKIQGKEVFGLFSVLYQYLHLG